MSKPKISRQKRKELEALAAEQPGTTKERIRQVAPPAKPIDKEQLKTASQIRTELQNELQKRSSMPVSVNLAMNPQDEFYLEVRSLECDLEEYNGLKIIHIPVAYHQFSKPKSM